LITTLIKGWFYAFSFVPPPCEKAYRSDTGSIEQAGVVNVGSPGGETASVDPEEHRQVCVRRIGALRREDV
jgi:hypothetical protein